MAISVTHSTVVVVPDDGVSPVGTDEWNAGHVITGAAILASPNHFTDTTASISPITGSMVLDGGLGVAMDVISGGNLFSSGFMQTTGGIVLNGTALVNFGGGTDIQWFDGLGAYKQVWTSLTTDFYSDTFRWTAANLTTPLATLNSTNLNLPQTTASSSTATGALTVAGGVGIAGALNVGGIVNFTAGVTSGGNPLIVTGPAKATAAFTGLVWQSSDVLGPLQAGFQLVTDPTGANRRLSIYTIEQTVGYRNVSLVEDGGNLGVGTAVPTEKLHVTGNGLITGTLAITSASASALAVGRQGTTNPVLQVDASTATVLTGLNIKGAGTGAGLALSVVESGGTNNALTIDAMGSGTITLGGTSTGAITLTRATTMSAALTYGGVTLTNAVTGTGKMVLDTSPTLSGTIGGAVTFSGALTLSSALTYGGVTLNNAVTGTGNMVLSASPTLSGTVAGAHSYSGALTLSAALTYGGVTLSNSVTGTGSMALSIAPTFTGTLNSADHVITSAGASALAVGRQGATNPVLQVDASTATVLTGLKIKGAGTGAGLALSVVETGGTNNALTIDAMGSGTITLGATSTGAITLTRATTISAALTYGGVTLTNNVIGTGKMVLDNTPTLITPVIGVATGTSLAVTGLLTSSSASAGIGYATGAGGTITQLTSRTTGVTLSKTTGAITLFAAAPVVGTWVSFTVTNTQVAATDVVKVCAKSGTNTYITHVTTVASGSFQISFTSIVGTSSDSPVFNFAVIKGVTA